MKKFWLNCLLATATVFALMWALSKLTSLKMFDAFDPIGQALNDFELTDYAFSSLREEPSEDSRIVLVNIGSIPRAGIAEQIRIISKYKPKVIGIDSFFYCEGGFRDSVNCPAAHDMMGNLLLANAIEEAGNVVLVSKLHQSKKLYDSGVVDEYDSVAYSDAIFQDHAYSGFANLATDAEYQEDVKICRSFVPKVYVKEEQQLSFAVKIAMLYDSTKTKAFLARDNHEELINFARNVEAQNVKSEVEKSKENLGTTNFYLKYAVVDVDQIFREEFEPDLFKDKIVLMGYLGDYFGDSAWEDKFFTPLNKKVAGRANPDMFGMVIHANILSMILDGNFIDELEEWHQYVIGFVFCFFNIALFFYINSRFPVWFDSVSLSLQVLEIVLLMGFTIWIFDLANFKLDLTIALAAIALSGPTFEFYDNVLYSLVRIWRNKRLTNQSEEVLTTQKEEIS